jgi:hypothetical protein
MDFVVADFVEVNFVFVVLEEEFGWRRFLAFALKGFAIGARRGSPFAVVADLVECFAGGCFLEASIEEACVAAVHAIARKRSAAARRWNDIYCTPMGLAALSGLVEVSERTVAGSFGWGPG